MARMECEPSQGCLSGYVGIDFGSTYTSAAFIIPTNGRYLPENMARVRAAATYLEIASELAENEPTKLNCPWPFLTELPLENVMDVPKVLLMDRGRREMRAAKMFNEIIRTWKGINCPNDSTPSSLYLEGYCQMILRRFRLIASPDQRPAFVFTYPSGYSPTERLIFDQAVKAAGVYGLACKKCKITYREEGEAAVSTALKDHRNQLLGAHKSNDAIIVADYGGITDDIVTFRFDRTLGGKSTLPGKITQTQCHWTGARAVEGAFKEKLLEAARQEASRYDEQFADEVRRDLDREARRWVNTSLPHYLKIEIWDDGASATIGRKRITVRRDAITSVIQDAAEEKATVLFKMIKTEAIPPTHLFIVGGFSKCRMLYNEVVSRLETKLAAEKPPIAKPTVLPSQPNSDPQLAVSRGAILSVVPGLL